MNFIDANHAYAQIKPRIITTALRAGSVIQESALMAELGLAALPSARR